MVAIPNLLGLIAMIITSHLSDRMLERRYHMAALAALAGTALLLLGAFQSMFLLLVLFSAVAIGAYSFLPIFFSMPGEFLTGFSEAAGIALITSVANLGGSVGPYTLGLIREQTGDSSFGLAWAGVSFLLSASLSLLLPGRGSPQSGTNHRFPPQQDCPVRQTQAPLVCAPAEWLIHRSADH
jgi:ACS family tartrate transporter-like MFS transporter